MLSRNAVSRSMQSKNRAVSVFRTSEYKIRRVAEKQLKSAAVVLKPVLRFGQRGSACAQALGLFAAVLAVCAGASLGGDGDGHAAVGHGVEAQCLHDHKLGNVAIV